MRSQEKDNPEEKRRKLHLSWQPESHKNKLIFAKSLCVVAAICIIALIFVFMQIVNEINVSMEDTINLLEEERFDQIYLYATELRKTATESAEEVAFNIEQDIKYTMDMDQLKDDLDNNIMNENLHMIFRNNISESYFNGVNNQRNGVFITSMDGILEDLNYHRASTTDNTERDWEYEISHAYNSVLEKDAVYKLTNHSKEVIMSEHVNRLTIEDDNFETHTLIASPTYNALKSVYIEEGIDGLKNYQYLNPAYILDTEDIFGQANIIEGTKQDTHTFIVVQEFNLYDQIKSHHSDLMNDEYIESVELHYHNVLNIMYIFGIFYSVILVIALAFVSNKFNTYFDKHDLGNIPQKDKNTIQENV